MWMLRTVRLLLLGKYVSYKGEQGDMFIKKYNRNNKVYTNRGFVIHASGINCDTSTAGIMFTSVKYSGNSDLIIACNDSRIEGNNNKC